ncbi:MAG: carboxypeptidase-like regulatory domain-containing protein [Bacteroidales bacterium]|nr:carboxypeptidase-like regulatory domain-containing protein [Bacteroidales bacterium]
MNIRLLLFSLILIVATAVNGQERGMLTGSVKDSIGDPVDLANVALLGTGEGTMTKPDGSYELEIPAGRSYTVVISCVGYRTKQFAVRLNPGESRNQEISLQRDIRSINEVSVTARQERASTFQRINVEELNYMPTSIGKVETIIKSQAGVSSNNELSSQYSVRGGNFDENLVYVNDIEIYRPFLVRSGQQEGLSFVNSDLVSSIKFSAGGYDARYGDKMSSALDITYKRPRQFRGSTSVSLLGASAHLEGASKTQRFTFLAGYRYKTTSYLLNTLETSGDYKPQFSDFQTLLTYQLTRKMEISFLGNYSSNIYQFVPATRNTQFGTKDLPLNLKIYYDGQEVDQFDTYLGALSLRWTPVKGLSLKVIGSAFRTSEEETFDIMGQYWINELDNTVNSETYGDSILNIGVGTVLSHARNYLDAIVISGSHLGSYQTGNMHLQWGINYQYQDFYDHINEWELIDSAGYVIPYDGKELILTKSRRSENKIAYDQFSGFIQNTLEINNEKADFFVTTGIRGTVWNFNRTTMISPRVTVSTQPNWKRDMMFHFSAGYFYQPPFYKEMRMPDGTVNYDIEPQRSIHVLMGGDYIFSLWDRPFKLTGEAWYKWLNNLIPYKIENVRLSYAGENISEGFARGIDFKLNGEFVHGAESWLTLSLLQTREDVEGDVLLEWNGSEFIRKPAGEFPRPTDQLFTFGLYFQDYFPNNPGYKVHLNAFYGSGLPLSSPNEEQYYTNLRMHPYRRVDIGFSKVIKRETDLWGERNPLRFFESIWLSAEIFNLLGINNEASYLWVRTISDQRGIPGMFGIPNYLTGRRFNFKISVSF